MQASHTRQPGELAFLFLAVVFSVAMLWVAYGISRFDAISSAGAFPMACAATMLVTGLMNLVRSARSPWPSQDGSWWTQWRSKMLPLRLAVFTLLIVAYMLLLEWLGFLLASYLFLLVSMQVLGSRRFGLNLLVSAVVLAAIFVVFRTAFSVLLPTGTLVGPYLPELLK